MLSFLRKKRPSSSNTTTIKIKISGMHCTSCSMNIDGELEDVSGIVSANTKYANSISTITYHPSKIDQDRIKQIIVDLGYQVV